MKKNCFVINLYQPNTGQRKKINLNFYFPTSLWLGSKFCYSLYFHERTKEIEQKIICAYLPAPHTDHLNKADHLEMAYDLITNTFLNVFYRTASHRGLPVEMLSDNVTILAKHADGISGQKLNILGCRQRNKRNFMRPLPPRCGRSLKV